MKKIISILLALAMLALFAGCGNQAGRIDYVTTVQGEPVVGTEVGDVAPDFSLELLSGETIQLSELRGKVVFLNFWATWCGPCVQEFPALQKLHETFPDELMLLAIDVGETKAKVEPFVKEQGVTFRIGLDETNAVSTLYPTEGIPLSVVINAEGIITYTRLGAGNNMFPFYEKEVKIALGQVKNDTLPLSEEEEFDVERAYMDAYMDQLFWFYENDEPTKMALGKDGKEIDGKTYYQVEPSERRGDIATLAGLKAHMKTLYTEAFMEQLLALGIYRDFDGALYAQPAARLKAVSVSEQTRDTVKTGESKYVIKLSYVETSNKTGGFTTKDLTYANGLFSGFTLVMGEEPA